MSGLPPTGFLIQAQSPSQANTASAAAAQSLAGTGIECTVMVSET